MLLRRDVAVVFLFPPFYFFRASFVFRFVVKAKRKREKNFFSGSSHPGNFDICDLEVVRNRCFLDFLR